MTGKGQKTLRAPGGQVGNHSQGSSLEGKTGDILDFCYCQQIPCAEPNTLVRLSVLPDFLSVKKLLINI